MNIILSYAVSIFICLWISLLFPFFVLCLLHRQPHMQMHPRNPKTTTPSEWIAIWIHFEVRWDTGFMRFEYTHSAYAASLSIQNVCVYLWVVSVCFPHQCDAWKYICCRRLPNNKCIALHAYHIFAFWLSFIIINDNSNNNIIIMCTSHQIGFCNCFIKRKRA